MIKRFFHIRENGIIQYQGMVTRRDNDCVYIQYFNWINGCLSGGEHKFHIDETKDWTFYNTDKEMKEAYKKENPDEAEL